MKLDALRSLVVRVTYKPGWVFSLQPIDHGLAFLSISFEAPDATNPTARKFFNGRHAIVVADVPSERGFLNRLRSYILHIEMHELDEFLQVDGVAPFDPHQGTAS